MRIFIVENLLDLVNSLVPKGKLGGTPPSGPLGTIVGVRGTGGLLAPRSMLGGTPPSIAEEQSFGSFFGLAPGRMRK